jgi:2-polyprenyl-3-methyl-5-hydroxy-6-metoxy-1,4-benzoquinol methylase
MSVIYKILYQVGLTPWEGSAEQARTRAQISAMFDREENGRQPPFGPALDLGCGGGLWSIELARRGWEVTGVDLVPKALRTARERASKAGVEVRFVEGDIAALRAAEVGSGFQLLLDFGAVHGLKEAQREAVGREVSAVAAANAT